MPATVSYSNQKLVLDVNPHEISYSYNLNTSEMQTIAGKVVQILSVNIGDLTLSSTIGGSRGKIDENFNRYMKMVQFCRNLMIWQADTNKPAYFAFPELSYSFKVFLRGQTFTDDFKNVAYPYSMTFSVDEDITGVATTTAMESALSKVKKDVGFAPGQAGWHGGNETYKSGSSKSKYDPIGAGAPKGMGQQVK